MPTMIQKNWNLLCETVAVYNRSCPEAHIICMGWVNNSFVIEGNEIMKKKLHELSEIKSLYEAVVRKDLSPSKGQDVITDSYEEMVDFDALEYLDFDKDDSPKMYTAEPVTRSTSLNSDWQFETLEGYVLTTSPTKKAKSPCQQTNIHQPVLKNSMDMMEVSTVNDSSKSTQNANLKIVTKDPFGNFQTVTPTQMNQLSSKDVKERPKVTRNLEKAKPQSIILVKSKETNSTQKSSSVKSSISTQGTKATDFRNKFGHTKLGASQIKRYLMEKKTSKQGTQPIEVKPTEKSIAKPDVREQFNLNLQKSSKQGSDLLLNQSTNQNDPQQRNNGSKLNVQVEKNQPVKHQDDIIETETREIPFKLHVNKRSSTVTSVLKCFRSANSTSCLKSYSLSWPGSTVYKFDTFHGIDKLAEIWTNYMNDSSNFGLSYNPAMNSTEVAFTGLLTNDIEVVVSDDVSVGESINSKDGDDKDSCSKGSKMDSNENELHVPDISLNHESSNINITDNRNHELNSDSPLQEEVGIKIRDCYSRVADKTSMTSDKIKTPDSIKQTTVSHEQESTTLRDDACSRNAKCAATGNQDSDSMIQTTDSNEQESTMAQEDACISAAKIVQTENYDSVTAKDVTEQGNKDSSTDKLASSPDVVEENEDNIWEEMAIVAEEFIASVSNIDPLIEPGYLKCSKCDQRFQRQANLERHELSHYNLKRCRDCNGVFDSAAWKEHLKIQCVKSHKCQTCGEGFRNETELHKHTFTHTGVKPYICDVCDKGFFNKTTLDTHKTTHGERKFACETCGKKFLWRQHLKRHMKVHAAVKPYVCNICGKGLSKLLCLEEHMRLHSGDKPHKCPTCGKQFSHHTSIHNHIMRAHKGRSYLCDHCGASLTDKQQFERHVKRHGEKRFKCKNCKNRFYEKTELDKHLADLRCYKLYLCEICKKSFYGISVFKKHQSIHLKRQHLNNKDSAAVIDHDYDLSWNGTKIDVEFQIDNNAIEFKTLEKEMEGTSHDHDYFKEKSRNDDIEVEENKPSKPQKHEMKEASIQNKPTNNTRVVNKTNTRKPCPSVIEQNVLRKENGSYVPAVKRKKIDTEIIETIDNSRFTPTGSLSTGPTTLQINEIVISNTEGGDSSKGNITLKPIGQKPSKTNTVPPNTTPSLQLVVKIVPDVVQSTRSGTQVVQSSVNQTQGQGMLFQGLPAMTNNQTLQPNIYQLAQPPLMNNISLQQTAQTKYQLAVLPMVNEIPVISQQKLQIPQETLMKTGNNTQMTTQMSGFTFMKTGNNIPVTSQMSGFTFMKTESVQVPQLTLGNAGHLVNIQSPGVTATQTIIKEEPTTN